MNNDKRQELKNKIDELVKEKLAKFRSKIQKELEEDEEEEENCIEPFLLLDSSEFDLEELKKYCEEEGLELHIVDDVNDIQEFQNLSDVLHPEACPSLDESECYLNEEEIEYIPINEVELNEEELEELNEIAEDIKAIDNVLLIPCEVNGKEKLLIETVNCNIKAIPLLGIYLVAPINIEFVRVVLDADMQSDEEIEVEFIFNDKDVQVHMKLDLHTLVNAGIVSLACVEPDPAEPLKVSPAEFRGMTAPVDINEINNLF
jgi:hypothetical protein